MAAAEQHPRQRIVSFSSPHLGGQHLLEGGEVVVSVGPIAHEHQRVDEVGERVREVGPQRQGLPVARDRLEDVVALLTVANGKEEGGGGG